MPNGSMDGGGGGGGGLQIMAPPPPPPNSYSTVVSFHKHDYSGGSNDPGVFGSWLLPC